MIIREMSRRAASAKRLDVSILRELAADKRLHVALGVVNAAEAGASHFQLIEDGGVVVDVAIDVELMPAGEDVTCRLGSLGGGAGQGFWSIPAPGSEVLVCLPDGRLDWQPTIVAVLSSGEVPARVGDGRTVIVARERIEVIAPTVYVSSDGTTGQPLVTRSEFNDHEHPTGVGPSGKPVPVTGTAVLRAE